VFGFGVPESCPGIPAEILDPRNTWEDPAAYDRQARELAARFIHNFEKYAAQTPPEILDSAPKF
jgi:phosphoenolpyruvate carboxykinase (ATP)